MTDNRTTELLPCPFCGGEAHVFYVGDWWVEHACKKLGKYISTRFCETEEEAAAWWNTRSTRGTLTAEQVRDAIERHVKFYEGGDYDEQVIADELNAVLGSGNAKNLLLRTFGVAQMMYDCWLEECKAGDNVDASACNAYSYEFDQIAQAMFDMGIDPNDGDYYRSGELVIADELNAKLGSDDEYEAKMDALLCRLTNGKWSKSRAYDLDFMVSCVDEEYETLHAKELAELGSGTCEYKPMWDENDLSGRLLGNWYTGCGNALTWDADNDGCCEPPAFCPYCGRKVTR